MTDTVIVAIISLLGTLLGSFGGTQLVKYRIEQLEKKVEKHNSIVEKTYILEEIRKQRQAGCRLLVIEAALLLEEHYEEFCNNVWYIHTDAEIRIQRLMDSRGYTREKAESIIARQGSEEFFRKHSDYVIINNGDLKTTWKQIEEGIKLL